MRELIIGKNDAGQRLDRFLGKAYSKFSQGIVQKAIRKNQIKVNGKKQSADYKLCNGDVLKIYLKDDFFERSDTPDILQSADSELPPLNIIYEDENIMLIDKPLGLVVHEDNENTIDTLINRMVLTLIKRGEYNPRDELSFCPALCNRIDRNTSGIVIAAKNAEALRIMSEKIRDREVAKLYLCIACGQVTPNEQTLTAYLEKRQDENRVIVSGHKTAANKTIITRYRVLDSFSEMSLLEVELLTGRTHQIRAHMAYIGHALLGDGKYGLNKINKRYGLKTQALCSYKIRFDFKSDAGILNYLKGREFKTDNVCFLDKYYSEKEKV